MRDEDIVTIREEPELTPKQFYRRFVLGKVGDGLRLAVTERELRINVDNITPLLSLLRINACDETVLDLIRDALIDTMGEIRLEDFASYVLEEMNTSEEFEEECIKSAFSLCDNDGDDNITAVDIYKLMMGIGEMICDEEILDMIRAVDSNGDDRVTYTDFRNFILDIEPEPAAEEEEEKEEEKKEEVVEVVVVAACPLPVVEQEPQPEHKARRRLFSYSHMITKQIAVIRTIKAFTSIKSVEEDVEEKPEDEEKERKKKEDETEQHLNGSEESKQVKVNDFEVKNDEDSKEIESLKVEKLSNEVERKEPIEVKNDEDSKEIESLKVEKLSNEVERKEPIVNETESTERDIETTANGQVLQNDIHEKAVAGEEYASFENESDAEHKTLAVASATKSAAKDSSSEFLAAVEKQIINENDVKTQRSTDEPFVPKTYSQDGEVLEDLIVPVRADVTLNKRPARTVNLPTEYVKKSPYHGRIRPAVFSTNALLPLGSKKKKQDINTAQLLLDTPTDTSSSDEAYSPMMTPSDRMVVMVDQEQQTDFDEEFGDLVSAMKLCLIPTGVGFEHEQKEILSACTTDRKDNSTLTDIYGIPHRVKKMKRLEKAILKRRETSFDIFQLFLEKTEAEKFPSHPLLKRAATSRSLSAHAPPVTCSSVDRFQDSAQYRLFLEEAEAEKFPSHPLLKRAVISRTMSAHVPRVTCNSVDRFRDGLHYQKRVPFPMEQFERETSPVPNPPSKSPTERWRFASDFYDRKHGRIVPDSSRDEVSNLSSHRVSVVNVSRSITDEKLYECDVKISETHHGFKSIRPLARVMMAFKSAAKNARDARTATTQEMNSISRLLEETGIHYVRPTPRVPVHRTESLSRNNSRVLLEFPVDKEFRPKLKRASTLTRIPVDTGERHNLPLFLG